MNNYLFLATAAAVLSAQAAAFQNLNFDEARTNNLTIYDGKNDEGFGSPEELFPSWQVYQANAVVTNVAYNTIPLGQPYARIVSAARDPDITEGKYSADFENTMRGTVPFSIVQKGDVPANTSFLRYRYQEFPFTLSMNGIEVPSISPLMRSFTPVEAIYDVSSFAGQTVELKLTTSFPFGVETESHHLDSIQFVMAPSLSITRTSTDLVLSWPASAMGYVLQSTAALSSSNSWQAVPGTPVVIGNEQMLTTDFTGKAEFFRLSTSP
jgi:hypothetical protein